MRAKDKRSRDEIPINLLVFLYVLSCVLAWTRDNIIRLQIPALRSFAGAVAVYVLALQLHKHGVAPSVMNVALFISFVIGSLSTAAYGLSAFVSGQIVIPKLMRKNPTE